MVNNDSFEAELDRSSASSGIDFKGSIEKLKEEIIRVESDVFVSILDCWIQTCVDKDRIYSEITENLLNIKLSDNYDDEDLTLFNFNLDNIHACGLERSVSKEAWNEFIDKIKDHVRLVEHQKKLFSKVAGELNAKQTALGVYFSEKTSELEQQSREIAQEIISLESKMEELSDFSDKVKKKSKKMQKDFISILGIFAAILLASFGGLTILSDIFNNIEAPLGKVMIMGSLCLMSILTILFLLLNGIAKLTGERLRNCRCKKGKCTCTVDKKHPTLFVSGIASIIIILVGSFELLVDFEYIRQHSNLSALIITFTLLILIVIIIACIYIFIGYQQSKRANN